MRRHLILLLLLFGCGPSYAQINFLYTNDDPLDLPNTVSAFSVDAAGALVPLPGSPFETGGRAHGGNGYSGRRIIASPDGRFLFVSNTGSNDISVFAIDGDNGDLAPVADSPFATGNSNNGVSLTVTPNSKFLYVTSLNGSNILGYSVADDGRLSQLPGFPLPLSSAPMNSAISPDGRFLAVALLRFDMGLIAMFTIGSDGSLTVLPSSPFQDGIFGTIQSLDINCASDRMYAGNSSGLSKIDVLSISGDGTVGHIAGSPFTPPGNGVFSILLAPDGRHLFSGTQNGSQAAVNAFDVDLNGGLSAVAGSPFDAPSSFLVGGLATTLTGDYLFAASGHRAVNSFGLAGDGALALVPNSPFETGHPSFIISIAAYPPRLCQIIPEGLQRSSPVTNNVAQTPR
jgi:6-phosphogluconolactonase (cycloisomerase 2 family)